MNILFLAKLKVGRRSFFKGTSGCRVRLPPRVLSCYKSLKKSLFLCNLKLFQYMSDDSSCWQEKGVNNKLQLPRENVS